MDNDAREWSFMQWVGIMGRAVPAAVLMIAAILLPVGGVYLLVSASAGESKQEQMEREIAKIREKSREEQNKIELLQAR